MDCLNILDRDGGCDVADSDRFFHGKDIVEHGACGDIAVDGIEERFGHPALRELQALDARRGHALGTEERARHRLKALDVLLLVERMDRQLGLDDNLRNIAGQERLQLGNGIRDIGIIRKGLPRFAAAIGAVLGLPVPTHQTSHYISSTA